MTPEPNVLQTPLQHALQGPGAAVLLQAHGERLRCREAQLRRSLAQGLAPADYVRCQQLLAMCEAAQRVLLWLGPAAPDTPTGPAGALLRRPPAF